MANYVIAGGGPAGLYTAYRLLQGGALRPGDTVQVYEWSKRPGGRILSYTFPDSVGSDGLYCEFGGMRFATDPNFPDPKMLEKMGKFNDELGKVFKITDLNGLHPLTEGARVNFTKGKATVTDGPFIETKEVLGGYWILEAPSKEDVVKWAQKCPALEGDIIEVREIFDFETK